MVKASTMFASESANSKLKVLFLLWSSCLHFLKSNAEETYVRSRFVGNESVDSLAYGGPYLAVYQLNRTLLECGSLCAKWPTCESVNYITPSNVDAKGRCELINGTTWTPSKFETRPTEFSRFYVSLSLASASFFKIIPAISGGTEDVTISPWATDCMTQAGGLTGFVVAQRNSGSTSLYTLDVKCRVFRHGLIMTSDPPIKVSWNTYANNSMQCPDGYIVTAFFDYDFGFPSANAVRCNKPALPWRVNATGCRTIDVLRRSPADPVSPMNDAGLTGTAGSVWGAQCGTSLSIEALVGTKITGPGYFYDKMFCCPLYT